MFFCNNFRWVINMEEKEMERKQQNTVPSNNSKETTRKGKRFVRYKAGAEMYSISQKKFERLAHEANAVYKLNKVALVNLDILDEYLETCRIIKECEY